MGALVAWWELSRLPEKRLELFLVLLLHVAGTYLYRKRHPSDQTKRVAALTLLAAGLIFAAWQLPRLPEQNTWVLVAMGSLAAVTHILKQLGPTAGSSYQVSFMIYGFSIVLLGAPATILIIIVAHVLEHTWGANYPWYIQWFNIATFVLSTSAAGLIAGSTNTGQSLLTIGGLVGFVAAFVVFVLLNHFLIGLVLKTARDQSFKQSGVFGSLTLMIDFSLLCMGGVAALLWRLNPYATFLGVIPLYLVYRTLRMPALERQTETDAKTGVYNAAYFANSIQEELARAHRFGRPLTLVMGDLDMLRGINNRYGHLAGDAVLTGVARTLRDMARDYDVVARFGGEEFAILMPETTPEAAKPLIESMRQAIADAEFPVSTNVAPIKATMSFGIAGREHTGQSVDDLIHKADLTLYQAKENGRNQVVIYTHEGEDVVTDGNRARIRNTSY
jgi:diguanylate cyclase (GGDEF)-like protein